MAMMPKVRSPFSRKFIEKLVICLMTIEAKIVRLARYLDLPKASFDGFRADPAWVAAKEASEKKAGGSLTIKDGVKSEFLVPMDYSPVK